MSSLVAVLPTLDYQPGAMEIFSNIDVHLFCRRHSVVQSLVSSKPGAVAALNLSQAIMWIGCVNSARQTYAAHLIPFRANHFVARQFGCIDHRSDVERDAAHPHEKGL